MVPGWPSHQRVAVLLLLHAEAVMTPHAEHPEPTPWERDSGGQEKHEPDHWNPVGRAMEDLALRTREADPPE